MLVDQAIELRFELADLRDDRRVGRRGLDAAGRRRDPRLPLLGRIDLDLGGHALGDDGGTTRHRRSGVSALLLDLLAACGATLLSRHATFSWSSRTSRSFCALVK